MDMQTWKEIWQVVFFAACFLFYLIVVVVALKGFGDMKSMIAQMRAAGRKD